MTVPKEFSQKIASPSSHSLEKSKKAEFSEEKFNRLLESRSLDKKSHKPDLFSLMTQNEEEKEGEAIYLPPLSLSSSDIKSASFSTACTLSLDMEAIFEKMAACMIVMNSSDERETTLFLEGSRFENSSLLGTQITIREFSSAPKAFNVEILSNPQALAMIDAAKSDLLAAFQNGNFLFTIHRLDTSLESDKERPVFYRKEGSDQGQQDQKGERGT